MDSQILSEADFTSNFLNVFGQYLALVPTIKDYSNVSGEQTLTIGTASIILAIYVRMKQNWFYDKQGNVEGGDAYLMCAGSVSINKDDFIYCDGLDYSLSTISGNATTISGTTTSAHGLSIGSQILITNTTNYNGLYTIATTPTTSTFTITDASHNLAAETSGRLTRNFNKYVVKELLTRYGQFVGSQEKCYTYCNLFLYNRGS